MSKSTKSRGSLTLVMVVGLAFSVGGWVASPVEAAEVVVAPESVPCSPPLDLAAVAGPSAEPQLCQPEATPAAEGTVPEPEFLAKRKLGFCHCGCSATPTCRTSADCGGASCDTVISCC